jgi:hypothetical protein
MRFNHSAIGKMQEAADVLIIQIPDKVRENSLIINNTEFQNDTSLAVFIGESDAVFLLDYVNQSKTSNQTVQAFFMQVS